MQRGQERHPDRLKKKDYRIGFQILLSGLWPPTWSKEYDDAKECIPWPEQEDTGYIRIRRGDFKNYVTGELGLLCSMWKRIKNYGLPQGRGYLAEPRFVMDVVRLFDCETEVYRRWRENH